MVTITTCLFLSLLTCSDLPEKYTDHIETAYAISDGNIQFKKIVTYIKSGKLQYIYPIIKNEITKSKNIADQEMLIGILGEVSTDESISLILELMEDDFIETSLFSTDIRVALRNALFKKTIPLGENRKNIANIVYSFQLKKEFTKNAIARWIKKYEYQYQ